MKWDDRLDKQLSTSPRFGARVRRLLLALKSFAGGSVFLKKVALGACALGHLLLDQQEHAKAILAQSTCAVAPGLCGLQGG